MPRRRSWLLAILGVLLLLFVMHTAAVAQMSFGSLPVSTDCSRTTRLGFCCLDSDDLKLYCGSGSAASQVGGGHTMLSSTHSDTTAGVAVARGSIITGQPIGGPPTDTWARLTLGASGTYLRSDGTDALWAAPRQEDITGHGVRMHNSANISIASATMTPLTFDTESDDTDGYHSTSSNTDRVTIPSGLGGWYTVWCGVDWAGNATGVRAIVITINGGVESDDYDNPATDGFFAISHAVVVKIAAGAILRCAVYQNTGGNLNVNRSASLSPEMRVIYHGQ